VKYIYLPGILGVNMAYWSTL